MKMGQPKKPSFFFLLSMILVLVVRACTAAAPSGGKPLVTLVTKFTPASVYTAPGLASDRPVVLDLLASGIFTTCGSNEQRQRLSLSARETDGRNPNLPRVSFPLDATCAPNLVGDLVTAVAGLGCSPFSFPAQVAGLEKIPNRFALCLPTGDEVDDAGAAIFGGGQFFSPAVITKDQSGRTPGNRLALESTLSAELPLVTQQFQIFGAKSAPSAGYFVSVSAGIAVGGNIVADAGSQGNDFIGFSTTSPFTELRDYVHDGVVAAFDKAMGPGARVPPPPGSPFELCYDTTKLPPPSGLGYMVPRLDMVLQNGVNWTDVGLNSMKHVDRNTACFAYVRMKQHQVMPAAIVGGFQMEGRLLVFDEEKHKISFSGPLQPRGFSCGIAG